jgi:hypothetical protein
MAALHPARPSRAGQRARTGRARPQPGLVFDEASADHRQPAQRLLEARRLAHTPPLTVEDHPTSGRRQFHPPDGVKRGSLTHTRFWLTAASPI